MGLNSEIEAGLRKTHPEKEWQVAKELINVLVGNGAIDILDRFYHSIISDVSLGAELRGYFGDSRSPRMEKHKPIEGKTISVTDAHGTRMIRSREGEMIKLLGEDYEKELQRIYETFDVNSSPTSGTVEIKIAVRYNPRRYTMYLREHYYVSCKYTSLWITLKEFMNSESRHMTIHSGYDSPDATFIDKNDYSVKKDDWFNKIKIDDLLGDAYREHPAVPLKD